MYFSINLNNSFDFVNVFKCFLMGHIIIKVNNNELYHYYVDFTLLINVIYLNQSFNFTLTPLKVFYHPR